MKITIGFENVAASGYIFDDLAEAGLPADSQFLLVSATDIEPFPEPTQNEVDDLVNPHIISWQNEISAEERSYLATMLHNARQYASEKEAELKREATAGCEMLSKGFPRGSTECKVVMGNPYQAITAAADAQGADLIVVGSQNASALSRFFLGSISQRVLGFARKSVRVARAQAKRSGDTLRIMVAFDGSDDALKAVDAVAQRTWPAGTQVQVVTVDEMRSTSFFIKSLAKSRRSGGLDTQAVNLVHVLAQNACNQLGEAGLNAEPVGLTGDPKSSLLSHAASWKANSIFLGAHGHQASSGQPLGAVATVIATRADCSLEIVR